MFEQEKERQAFIATYNDAFFNQAQAHTISCLCGANRSTKLFDKDRYGLRSPTVVCEICGLVFTNPRPSEAFLRQFYQSDAYRYFYEGNDERDVRARNEVKYRDENFIHATCSKYLKQSGRLRPRVLEFGAGGGWNLVPFLAYCDAVGIDYSPILCEMGKERGITLLQGGLERLDDLQPGIDLIIANHVIEHFFDFIGCMKAIIAKLSENGMIYIGVPDIYYYDLSQIQNAHNYYFSPSTLEYYCRIVGLEPVESGKDDSGLHQYGVFKKALAEPPRLECLSSEYAEIIKRRRMYVLKNALGAFLDAVGLRGVVRKLRSLARRPR